MADAFGDDPHEPKHRQHQQQHHHLHGQEQNCTLVRPAQLTHSQRRFGPCISFCVCCCSCEETHVPPQLAAHQTTLDTMMLPSAACVAAVASLLVALGVDGLPCDTAVRSAQWVHKGPGTYQDSGTTPLRGDAGAIQTVVGGKDGAVFVGSANGWSPCHRIYSSAVGMAPAVPRHILPPSLITCSRRPSSHAPAVPRHMLPPSLVTYSHRPSSHTRVRLRCGRCGFVEAASLRLSVICMMSTPCCQQRESSGQNGPSHCATAAVTSKRTF